MPASRRRSERWLGLALAWAAAAAAEEVPPWRFTLPTLDGTRFVASDTLPRPVVINFWGAECPPCVREMPLLEHFAKQNVGWTAWLVATDAPGTARDFLAKHPVSLPVLRGGADVAGLMRAAGNRTGGLPYTVALGADGQLCFKQAGEVDTAALARMVAACAPRP